MTSQRYSPEFKDEAVRQIIERGYTVAEVSERLGVSSHSLYKWVKAVAPDKTEQQTADLVEAKSEVLRLRAQLRRTEEERDILKKAARYFARESEYSTGLLMIIGMSMASPRCVGCSAFRVAAFISGCTNHSLTGLSTIFGCWNSSEPRIQPAVASMAHHASSWIYARPVKPAASIAWRAS